VRTGDEISIRLHNMGRRGWNSWAGRPLARTFITGLQTEITMAKEPKTLMTCFTIP
jgi:hypothetical protein